MLLDGILRRESAFPQFVKSCLDDIALVSLSAFHGQSSFAPHYRTFRLDVLVAADTGNVHTPTMTLKNAALLALIGTILMTVLLTWTFVFNVVNVLRDVVAPVVLFSSFIYA